MRTPYYTQGQIDMYLRLGMTKEAARVQAGQRVMGALRHAGGWLRGKLPTWAGTKRFMIGQPGKFVQEARSGNMMAPGSTMREGLIPQGITGKALLYGFPAVEAAKTMRSEPGDRAERMGGILGGTAAGLAAWGPFGMVGSMVAGGIGERLGRGIARTGKHVVGATPNATHLQQQMATPANLSLGNPYNMPYTSQ